jgi:hypothetical protein
MKNKKVKEKIKKEKDGRTTCQRVPNSNVPALRNRIRQGRTTVQVHILMAGGSLRMAGRTCRIVCWTGNKQTLVEMEFGFLSMLYTHIL